MKFAGKLAYKVKMAKCSAEQTKIRGGITCITINNGETLGFAKLDCKLELAEVMDHKACIHM